MATRKKAAAPVVDESSPEALAVLAEQRRLVDVAVRYARLNGYCNQVNAVLAELLPHMVVPNGRYGELIAYDSNGCSCDGNRFAGAAPFNEDGYAENGFDRDGINRRGENREGFTVELGWNYVGRNAANTARQGRAATAEEVATEVGTINPTTEQPFAMPGPARVRR